jgi:hypothetical protein
MSLSRFSGEDPPVLSSMVHPPYLQLNLLSLGSSSFRLLVEPLALRLVGLLGALEVHNCTFISFVLSTDPWQAPIVFFVVDFLFLQSLHFSV